MDTGGDRFRNQVCRVLFLPSHTNPDNARFVGKITLNVSRPACQSALSSRLGHGRSRPALTLVRVKVPKRVVTPLTIDEVSRSWSSFNTCRDLAIVGLMLLLGLHSFEVLALDQDLILPETQIRVRGKGNKVRLLQLAPGAVQLLDHYLRLERPSHCGTALFVCLKGRARGTRMTTCARCSAIIARPPVSPKPILIDSGTMPHGA
jgi:site-specific recombinase XerC